MEPLEPPAPLFESLRQDLLTETNSIAKNGPLSTRQKLDRYLRHVKEFDAAWLLRLVHKRKLKDRAAARHAVIDQILEAVKHTASLAKVSIPPGIVPLGLTPDGSITPSEYPDRPARTRSARHLSEFPPAVREDQRLEAARWGDRDPARWRDDLARVDDPRQMAEKLAEWKEQVADSTRQDDPRRNAARAIYRPHGVFERAMPPDTLLDRILFRSEATYIERTLRDALMNSGEQRDDTSTEQAVTVSGPQQPQGSRVPASLSRKLQEQPEGPADIRAMLLAESEWNVAQLQTALQIAEKATKKESGRGFLRKLSRDTGVPYTTLQRFTRGKNQTLKADHQVKLDGPLRRLLSRPVR